MASDLRIRERITAKVDRGGGATLRRTWVVENIGLNTVDLPDAFFQVAFTNTDVAVESLQDGSGVPLPWLISQLPGNRAVVAFRWYANIPPGKRVVYHLSWSVNAYLVRLHEGRGWSGCEYFDRAGAFHTGALVVEEPRLIEFELEVADPRGRFPFMHNFFEEWQLASSVKCDVEHARRSRTLRTQFRLGPDGRSRDVITVSTIGSRAFWAGIVTTGFWTIVGAVLTSKCQG